MPNLFRPIRNRNTTPQRRLAFELLEQRCVMSADSLIGLDVLRADSRFDGLDGHGFSVVILDRGADLDHPFFGPDTDSNGVADRIVYSYDFADDDGNATEPNGSTHGMHVTTVLGSQDATYRGVAPGVNLIILKVFSNADISSADTEVVESALQWVAAHVDQYNIVAVNLSLGEGNYTTEQSGQSLSDEFADLADQGVIVAAAAGNLFALSPGQPGISYPAADPNVLSVGAVHWGDYNYPTNAPFSFQNAIDYTTGPDRIAGFSQRHSTLTDIFAPGTRIAVDSASPSENVERRGTSFATPFVTGAAVLAQQLSLQESGVRLTPSAFRDLIQSTGAVIVDGDDEHDSVVNTNASYRRLDLLAMAQSLLVDPGLPTLTVSDVSVTESNVGLTQATFTVRLSHAPIEEVSVRFATADGTATALDNDFQTVSGTWRFLPGDTLQRTFTVLIVGDTQAETDETCFVELSNASGLTVSTPRATVTIRDDDTTLPWHNPLNAHDVDGRNGVTSRDALLIIDNLNMLGSRALGPPPTAGSLHYYYDVTNDGRINSRDALYVISFLNNRGSLSPPAGSSGDGEVLQFSMNSTASMPPAAESFTRDAGNALFARFGDVAGILPTPLVIKLDQLNNTNLRGNGALVASGESGPPAAVAAVPDVIASESESIHNALWSAYAEHTSDQTPLGVSALRSRRGQLGTGRDRFDSAWFGPSSCERQ